MRQFGCCASSECGAARGVNRLAVVVDGDSTFRVMAERVGGGVGPVPMFYPGGGGLGGAVAAGVLLVMLVAILVGQRSDAAARVGSGSTLPTGALRLAK